MVEAIQKFKQLTGYNIQVFFEDFVLFCNSYYPLIVGYYTGATNVSVDDSFGRLETLMKQAQEIEPLFTLKANSLTGIGAWELLDTFTDCQTKLWTINNSSRWLRSVIIGKFSNNIALNRVLKSRENFEIVATELSSNDPQNAWFDIAKNNFVEEEDYDANNEGGMFKINIRQSGNYDIPNIVDNLSSEKILGRDMDVDFRFENNDIATVDYELAVRQAFNTILHCVKGAIPEFNDYGIPNDISGSSVNAVQYPVLFKHIMNMFQRDARWVQVNLIDVYRKEDNIFMKINAKTVTNNFLETNIQI
jgi:hypothetical protein